MGSFANFSNWILPEKILKVIHFLPNRLFRYCILCKHTSHHRLIPTCDHVFHPWVSDDDDALIFFFLKNGWPVQYTGASGQVLFRLWEIKYVSALISKFHNQSIQWLNTKLTWSYLNEYILWLCSFSLVCFV